MTIDPESQHFLDWVAELLDDNATYESLVNEAIERAHSYYQSPKAQIITELRAKMEKGAIEHGAPRHTLQALQRELTNEYLDLLGWLLLEKWNQKQQIESQHP